MIRFRSHSDEDIEREEIIDEETSTLEDVLEDFENEKETVTEVEASEKALKFKISTEGNVSSSHRKSCPSSRKGSRERVQHFSSSDLARAVQRSKLKTGALSFDQHCLMRGKLSFDAPEFLDEYAIIRNNKSEPCNIDNNTDNNKYELLLSKETINLNKRNSLKKDLPSSSNDDILNVEELNKNDTLTNNKLIKIEQQSNDNLNNISIEHVSVKEEYENENKNTCSIFSRIKKITEQFSFTSSNDKDKKYKNLRINLRNTNILTSPCCRSLENIEDNNKSSSSSTNKINKMSGWFFLSKDKDDGWTSSSDADVYKLSTTTSTSINRNDNHHQITSSSLPSTSKSEYNCYRKNKTETTTTTIIDHKINNDKKTKTEYLRSKKTNFQIIQLNEPSSTTATTTTSTTTAT